MIPKIELPGGLITTRMGFGTSRLHYLSGRDRQDLLAKAADLGIVHYDTAPAYGDGLAESELGRFLSRGRDRFVVATKYGLPVRYSPGGIFARPFMLARALSRRLRVDSARIPDLTPGELRKSVEQSLKRLGTGWIDILFLHEPQVDRVPHPDAVARELAKLKSEGLIRAFGLAGSWSGIRPLFDVPGLAEVVQTNEAEWTDDRIPDITYGAISCGHQGFLAPPVASGAALDRFKLALSRRPRGVVLVSTTKTAHLSKLTSLFEAPGV